MNTTETADSEIANRANHAVIMNLLNINCSDIIDCKIGKDAYPIHESIMESCRMIRMTDIPEYHREKVAIGLSSYAERLAAHGFEINALELLKTSREIRAQLSQ